MVSLNHRVTIQARTSGQDEIGQPVETWADVATVWASVAYLSGLQAIKAGADVSILKASVRIRYRTGLDAGMRITHGAVVFDIKAVLPDARKQYVDLVCEVVS